MRYRKALEARDLNAEASNEQIISIPPPLIDNLLKSNNTLRRLRVPSEPIQQLPRNRQTSTNRTSRWLQSKPAQHQRRNKPRLKGRTVNTTAPQIIQRDKVISLDVLPPPDTTSLSSQCFFPHSMLSEPQTLLSHPRPLPTSPNSATKQQIKSKQRLSYNELFATSDPPSPLYPSNESKGRLNGTEYSQRLQQSHGKSPAVYLLNDDCLTEIFQWCASTATLCQLSSVCKRWRYIALQPYVWRTIDYTWKDFINQQQPLLGITTLWDQPLFGKRRKLGDKILPPSAVATKNGISNTTHKSLSYLMHTRTVRISNINKYSSINIHLQAAPDVSPFTFVRTLRLSSVQFYDIVNLIDWYPNLEVLDCDKIQVQSSSVTISLTVFSMLQQLCVLKLHFGSICELADRMLLNLGTDLTTSQLHRSSPHQQSQQQRWQLPSRLHTLAITNMYDIEESLTSGNSIREASQKEEKMAELIRSWNAMEDTLVRKYKVLTTLQNLTDLTLGSCTGFTAKIWRECVAPCTKQLTRLSLCGWDGNGSRESPLSWQARHHLTESVNPPSMMEDVELALAELLAGISSLESLSLFNFRCSPGLTHGITDLVQTQASPVIVCHIDATRSSHSIIETKPSIIDINALLDWTLHAVEFKFGTQIV